MNSSSKDNLQRFELAISELRWKYDASLLPFADTREVDPKLASMGQTDAIEALEFGLRCDAPGQNIYVRGVRSTGRLTMIQRVLKHLDLETDAKRDRCYVHNFSRPDRPRLIELQPGDGPKFAKSMKELAVFVTNNLRKAMESEPLLSQRRQLEKEIKSAARQISKPLEDELAANNMAMVQIQQGPVTQTAIMPTVNKQPVPPEQLKELIEKGEAPADALEEYEANLPTFQEKLIEITHAVSEVYINGRQRYQDFIQDAGSQLMETAAAPIRKQFAKSKTKHENENVALDAVSQFLDEVVQDAIDSILTTDEEAEDNFEERYGVNVVLTHSERHKRPVVEEIAPTFLNLMGTVEPTFNSEGRPESDYRGIRGGALLRADQGYLILNVNDLVVEAGAWRALMRTLRTGQLEMVPPEAGFMRPYMVVQPEPIKVKIRVILIGEAQLFYELDHLDSDFRELFKVLVDIDDEIPRDDHGVMLYAHVISGLAAEFSLPPFDASAIARLAEHGARIVARENRLTARFGRIEDIAREAAYLAVTESAGESMKPCEKVDRESTKVAAIDKKSNAIVTADHVTRAIARTKKRAGLPSRRFQQMVERKTIIVRTEGAEVGQINGLAVMRSGQLTYGFPARITATIGPGKAGIINIEGQAQMSGSIHTKGFHILGGLLRHMLHTEHPLAFSASLAFEQSYGGIDGDSASGAEVICLLSALTDIPIKQSMAMTGAIDQKGNLEAIGGVNEKIEGFYDACSYFGLTGEQGVVIPRSNAGDLMLREDIVKACSEGKFHIYAVDNIYDAMHLMTGVSSGRENQLATHEQKYPSQSILGRAVAAAHLYWRRTLTAPNELTSVEHLVENPVKMPNQTRSS